MLTFTTQNSVLRYFLHLAYLGKNYCGWQIQPNAVTVQGTIDKALRTLLRNPSLETVGCGRTDTGVHASAYYLHFDTREHIENTEKLIFQLNSILPRDIAIYNIFPVEESAHARFDATLREYHYLIHFKKSPFLQDTSVYHFPIPDLSLMNKAASTLVGKHDFTSFAKLHSDNLNNMCEVYYASWEDTDDGMRFVIAANRFLRNMVRAIVGTLLSLGNNKIDLDQFQAIFIAEQRSKAGMSAPAHGLYLSKINYPYLHV